MKKVGTIDWNKSGTRKWFYLVCLSVAFTVLVISFATSMSFLESALLALALGSLVGSLGRFCIAHSRSDD